MHKTSISPDEVLQTLLAKGPRSNKAMTLKALHEICREQYRRQNDYLRDFSLATIGRICESRGLFKARVLYNAASHDYVVLISSWATFSGTTSVKTVKEPRELHSHQYLMRIEDPALRSLMQAAIAERDDLRAKVNLLKSQMQITIDQRPLGVTLSKSTSPAAIWEVGARLTTSERQALEKSISNDFLAQEGWEMGVLEILCHSSSILKKRNDTCPNPSISTQH